MSKATVVMRFPAKKNGGCPKAQRDFPPRKDGILHPRCVAWVFPSPLPQSLSGRTEGQAGVRRRHKQNFSAPFLKIAFSGPGPLSGCEAEQ